ncbi:uracil-DNA glycosylase family protein [Halosimplex halobium]|uniref:uracil-DNA glycosylase family protein n=1 Tax=Halosimplex halobium TaxID=3396618 RepID=UPI003F5728F8
MKNTGRKIWENWKSDNGPCEGCPNRDCGGYFSPKTIETEGYSNDTNPDVLLVADTPGDNHPSDSEIGDVKRRYKDSPTNHPSELEKPYKLAVENRSIDWLVGNGSGQIPANFFRTLGGSLQRNEAGEVVKLEDIHYTNAKKCADIYPKEDACVENHAARYRCRSYLNQQLSELSPDVIVALGKMAFRETIKVLDYDIRITGAFKNIISPEESDVFESYGKLLPVIPSYHFRTVYRSYSQVGDFDSRYEYWEELAQKVRVVQESHSN